MPKPKVVVVSSNKGGCGKTTTSTSLAACLALEGHQVLLVDLDKQGQCSTFLGRDPMPRLYDLLVKERPLTELIVEARPRLHLLAGNSETIVAQDFARLRNAQADLLAQTIVDRAIGYDYIIFDTPPQGLFQECAVYSGDCLVVPVPLDYPGMDGAAQYIQLAQHLQKREQIEAVPTAIVPMFVDMRTSEARHNLGLLKERFGEQVLASVPFRTKMREAIADGVTIFEYAPKEDIAEIYQKITRTIVDVMDRATGAA